MSLALANLGRVQLLTNGDPAARATLFAEALKLAQTAATSASPPSASRGWRR